MGCLEDDLEWAHRNENRLKSLADDLVFQEVRDELARARKKFPRPQSSPHEGYGVLKEEFDECWDDIKANNLEGARAEAIQVAAMAVRLILEGLK
jgi:hypothetical protein